MFFATVFKNTRTFQIHTLIWILYIIYETSLNIFMFGTPWRLLTYVNSYLINILIFYINTWLLIRFAETRAVVVTAGIIIIEILLLSLAKIGLSYSFYQIGWDKINVLKEPFSALYAKSVWRSIYFAGLSTGYWFALSIIRHRKEISDLENSRLLSKLETERLEKKLVLSEIAYLKSQINPHFLFNTLSFLYNRAMQKVADLSEPILLLSDLMRYALTDTTQTGKVALDDEIEQIRTFIELNQYRFDHQLNIGFEVTGETGSEQILPLALLTPVENIFKYAELRDKEFPVKIMLRIQNNKLYFSCDNKKLKSKLHIVSHGVGLTNLKLRLDAYYPDNYTIDISETADSFTFKLQLTL